MFGKIFKYDFLSTGKKQLGLFAFALVTTIGLRLFDDLDISFFSNLFLFLTFIAVVAVFIGSLGIHILHYRNTLYKREAIIYQSLPVSFRTHFYAKVLNAIIWAYLTLGFFKVLSWIEGGFNVVFNISFDNIGQRIWLFVILTSVLIFGCVYIFFCITLGHYSRIRINGDLATVIALIANNIVLSILSLFAILHIPFSVLLDSHYPSELPPISTFTTPLTGDVRFILRSMAFDMQTASFYFPDDGYEPNFLGLGFVFVYIVFLIIYLVAIPRIQKYRQEL